MFNSFPHSSASSFVSFVLFCDDWIFGLMDFLDVGLILLLPPPTKGSRLNDALITFAACVDTLLRSRATVISLSLSCTQMHMLTHTQTLSLCPTSTHIHTVSTDKHPLTLTHTRSLILSTIGRSSSQWDALLLQLLFIFGLIYILPSIKIQSLSLQIRSMGWCYKNNSFSTKTAL